VPGLKSVGAENLGALVFFDQLADRLAVSLGEHQVGEANGGGANAEPLLGLRGEVGDLPLWIGPQSLLEALSEEVVLLVSLLGDHRLDRAPKLGIVALFRGAN
jgi:hypothetical protein